ncbi:STAS domain-containing protein [Pseudoalteromonas rubra]|uniref:STAS domain-containing protein n=1 Tax=Pseudoalteromonas rubra TaxID=43658 RepID=A0A5S3UQN5_9GAMM|nr:STAS domain-containing protein [Pseudoalteromonas rubra]QPB81759.1 STAS domain-containing protein [Pseudoalteromonas rubra]
MIKLPPELAINQVEELHQQLLLELDAGHAISLDISEIQRADTASIQLLCALQKYLLDIGQHISWVGESAALSSSVEKLGLTELLSISSTN